MDTILGITLSDKEKELILSCMKYTLEQDKENVFLTEEKRRLLSYLINEFSSLAATRENNNKDSIKNSVKKNFQLGNLKSIVMF
ncbi:hypothetical protein PU629_20660 [Pullulanibacillus sp. KACC 23026]|uniref:hypothetical protein n=1 Tax=Pullulanibacillus sp. KACC 23026 TaxID=3028315 RepID=UPI0023AF3A3D|nr:hypothetical protein [Pullulanibacillus sp. KACC 23026]WEG12481.1 hypothetical protein PU629_20660 [Pullulanibacillus sp. KACC 23026]